MGARRICYALVIRTILYFRIQLKWQAFRRTEV